MEHDTQAVQHHRGDRRKHGGCECARTKLHAQQEFTGLRDESRRSPVPQKRLHCVPSLREPSQQLVHRVQVSARQESHHEERQMRRLRGQTDRKEKQKKQEHGKIVQYCDVN